MDLIAFDTATPAGIGEKLQLRSPFTGEDLAGVTITLRGVDSAEFQQAQRSVLNRRLERTNAVQTAEKIEQEAIELLVSVTVDWEGIVVEGKEIKFTPDLARLLYADKRFPWIKEQVEVFISDRRNFWKPSQLT
jgi:hypothetical protein